jgi:geranylgeranyl diphosphate synthase type 3
MHYLFITENAPFALQMQLMQLFSDNKDDFTKLTDIVGLYYQILDDYYNLFRHKVNSELLVSDIWICPCVEASWSEGLEGVVVKPSSLYFVKQKCL